MSFIHKRQPRPLTRGIENIFKVRHYNATFGCSEMSRNKRQSKEDIRRVNLGCTITYLQSNVPHLLQTSLHEPRLSKDVELRIMPITHPYVPAFTGITKYYAVWNSIRFMLNNLVFTMENRVRINTLDVEKDEVLMRWETYPLIKSDSRESSRAVDETKISGIFIFVLNENCDKITTHVIDDVQIVGKDKKVNFTPNIDNGAVVYCK